MEAKALCQKAIDMMKRAYAPYSGYTVGAALETVNGTIYTGCNIENAAYSPTVCAERTAFFKAVSAGEQKFARIAVAGGKNARVESAFPPCGVCRQVMAEFCGPDFEILIAEAEGKYRSYTLRELLPEGFSPEHLKEHR